MTNQKTPDSAASALSAGLCGAIDRRKNMGWHHEECKGKCLACLIEETVRQHYGTQGLDFLRRKVGADETAQPAAWIRFCSDGTYEGPIMDEQIEDVRKNSGAWTPLYARHNV